MLGRGDITSSVATTDCLQRHCDRHACHLVVRAKRDGQDAQANVRLDFHHIRNAMDRRGHDRNARSVHGDRKYAFVHDQLDIDFRLAYVLNRAR